MNIKIEFDQKTLEEMCITDARALVYACNLPKGHWEATFNNKSYDPAFTCEWVEEVANAVASEEENNNVTDNADSV